MKSAAGKELEDRGVIATGQEITSLLTESTTNAKKMTDALIK